MTASFIVAARRTPIGRFLGSLSTLTCAELGGHAIRAAVGQAGIPLESIDQVVMGNVISAGVGQAPARQACRHAGLAQATGAVTVNKVCGSGLYAVMMADMAIRSGVYRQVVAGGMESMSQAPHILRNARAGWKYGAQEMLDSIDVDALRCSATGQLMGDYAESVAARCMVSRFDQDQWSSRSHQRAVAAQDSGRFQAEIIPIAVRVGKNEQTVSSDEGPRRNSTAESLSKLPTVFAQTESASESQTSSSTVTAGNSSILSDGAAALMVVDQNGRDRWGGRWSYRIVGHSSFAAAPQDLFTAPAAAIERLLVQTGYSKSQIDLFEINEAFASQSVACARLLGLDEKRINIHGGAIALGHPLGASGARVLVTLLHALHSLDLTRGVASLCLGGGEAVAMLVEQA